MIYLSGVKRPGIGLLQTPNTSYRLDDVNVWALDNGCFTSSYPGDEKYLALLDRWQPYADRCLWVAAPDVVGDREATLERWPGMAERIRARGYKACLVLQDRMTVDDVTHAAPDAVFVGGSDDFKLGPRARDILAAFDGPKHMGRVNSRKRLMYAARIGCDTADGTVFAFDPSRRVQSWVDEINNQLALGGAA